MEDLKLYDEYECISLPKEKVTKESYFVKTYNSFMRNVELTLAEKSLYIYIIGFGNSCFVSQKTMMRDLGITKPTLRKVLRNLEEKGYIYIQHRYAEDNNERLTNVYRYVPVDKNTGKPIKEIFQYYQDRY